MRGLKIVVGALAAVTVVGGSGAAPSAHASNYGVELNGTYRMMSDGEWAKTNEVFIDETTVVETWTLSSSCVSPIECEGQVTSDHGWTARLWFGYPNDYWVIDRIIPNWEPCPDGTFAPGEQRFQFYGFEPALGTRDMKIVDLLVGRQRTSSPSGACGRNQPLVIEMPVRLDKLS
ncbi:hypothetical protein [Mycobacterium sp.]|uniref:hypothetical protein n=1 Tax=Mycobacterium sp. TaxID=1785 RepID=UPI002DB07A8B|nr:hypothetical protein [Mycobacterium sp.]